MCGGWGEGVVGLGAGTAGRSRHCLTQFFFFFFRDGPPVRVHNEDHHGDALHPSLPPELRLFFFHKITQFHCKRRDAPRHVGIFHTSPGPATTGNQDALFKALTRLSGRLKEDVLAEPERRKQGTNRTVGGKKDEKVAAGRRVRVLMYFWEGGKKKKLRCKA